MTVETFHEYVFYPFMPPLPLPPPPKNNNNNNNNNPTFTSFHYAPLPNDTFPTQTLTLRKQDDWYAWLAKL